MNQNDFVKSEFFKFLLIPILITFVLLAVIAFSSPIWILCVVVSLFFSWSIAWYFIIKDVSAYLNNREQKKIAKLEDQLKKLKKKRRTKK